MRRKDGRVKVMNVGTVKKEERNRSKMAKSTNGKMKVLAFVHYRGGHSWV